MTTIIDGSAGITFPSGSNPQAAPSKVLQVVTASGLTPLSTSSTSFVSSGFSASITPLFSTSKILAFYSGNMYCAASSGGYISLYRNSSVNLAGGTNSLIRMQTPTAFDVGASFVVADTPATTSSTTYTVYFYTSVGANQVYIDINAGTAYSLTLMEIAA